MALVEREYARTNEGGVCTSLVEYDDVTLQLTALIMRGNNNEHSVISIAGTGDSRSDGLKDQPEVRMDLTADNVFMIADPDGGVSIPPDLVIGLDTLTERGRPNAVRDRRARLKPTEPIRRR